MINTATSEKGEYPFYAGLSGKMAALFLVGFLAISLPVNLFIYNKLQNALRMADTRQLEAEAEKLASQFKPDPLTIPLPAVGHSLNIVEVREGSFFSLFASPDFPALELSDLQHEVLELDTLKIFSKKIDQPGGWQVWFNVARSNQTVQRQLAEMKWYLFFVTGIAFAIMAVLVYALSALMLRPVKTIIASASHVQAGEEMQRLPVPTSHDETRQLAMALNSMIARIEATVGQQQRFFDSATHELKTPLSIMRAHLSQIPSEGNKPMEEIKEELGRLERLITDFLLASQIGSGMLTLRKEKIDLAEMVYACLAQLKTHCEIRQLTIQTVQTTSSLEVMADRDKMHTVVFNLLENAVQHSLYGSCIKITLSESNHVGMVVENASDEIKIDMAKLGVQRLAESRAPRGMGMGLWISARLVQLHSGKLRFSYEKPRFSAVLELPASPNITEQA